MSHAERFSLKDKVALVIGGSSGIGREIALGYQQAGARVMVLGKTPRKVDEVEDLLRKADPRATGYAEDVTDLARLKAVIDEVAETNGRLDVLVNSQGVTLIQPSEDFTPEQFDFVVDTNLKSVFFACLEAGRHMLARGEGAIINIGSVASLVGLQKSTPYTMSKHGVLGLTRTLGAEWATRGVRVNAIAPGYFLTELNREKMSAERKANAVRRTPMGRFGELKELVGAAVFLASPAASYVTGEIICVDGGYLAAGL
ncbi:MAG: SDR family NAD(P)-dependent oxidoreductase [Alphaproteobacteria bacterium]